MSQTRIMVGDCIERMRELDAESIDSIVCDPPYGIGFMGKVWDGPAIAAAAARDRATRRDLGPGSRSKSAYGNEAIIAGPVRGGRDFQKWGEVWAREALRVLKPGGHMLVFGSPRTSHRLTCAIEDAGFEIRDCLMWLYGSGFPKSMNVSKAIDKAAGVERKVVGRKTDPRYAYAFPESSRPYQGQTKHDWTPDETSNMANITAPATPDAERWEGWGTALKPAWEPIIMARKPLKGTVAANVLKHGTGAINIDACRIGTEARTGRWPANLILSHTEDCVQVDSRVVRGDQRETGAGTRPGGFGNVGADGGDGEPNAAVYGDEEIPVWECAPGCPVAALDAQTGTLTGDVTYGDTGGASRFFYCAKASKKERNLGLEGFEVQTAKRTHSGGEDTRGRPIPSNSNTHPTVKPIAIMRWLVRLVTPPGGVVLDPFMGSGTTGCAAALEGFRFIGIEREAEYVAIAKARILYWRKEAENA